MSMTRLHNPNPETGSRRFQQNPTTQATPDARHLREAMDILRVLTRGVKPTVKKSEPAKELPSAGARPNPQMFHDHVGDVRGTKRKRPTRILEGDESVEILADGGDDPSDVDYFAPKKRSELVADAHIANARPDDVPCTSEAEEPSFADPLLDEDECRRILRSHRLKFTVLAGRAEPESTKKPKKYKDKKVAKKDYIYPQPLHDFSDLRTVYGVDARVVKNLAVEGFKEPTEVQLGSLPLLIRPRSALAACDGELPVDRGVDFLAVAPTGSGKTVAFLVPAIDATIKRRAALGRGLHHHVLETIVVVPTRELANQIANEGKKLAAGTGVRVLLMRKGMRIAAESAVSSNVDLEETGSHDEDEGDEEESVVGEKDEHEKEEATMEKPAVQVDILITTPKTLLNSLAEAKSGPRKSLPTVRTLVLDEGDAMLENLKRQMLSLWKACTHKDLGVTIWSATMPSSIETLIKDQLISRAARLGTPPRPLVRLVVGLKDGAASNIKQKLVFCLNEAGKLYEMRNLLRPPSGNAGTLALRPPFLVFTQTTERAASLHAELCYDIPAEAGGGARRLAVLHSGLAPGARADVVRRFRSGEVWVLVTTDVLARGVDFAGVNGVVNYDVPGSAAAYVHRAGRTGRAGRGGGVVVTFWTRDDVPYVRAVATVMDASAKAAGRATEDAEAMVQRRLLDALPTVSKRDRKELKTRGVETRRAGARDASITTKSSWERRKDRNRLGAIEASKRRKREGRVRGQEEHVGEDGEESEWGGLDD